MNRIIGIDYAKGFAIILLLISHCLLEGNFRVWITSFDMPIFFVVCGILHQMRHSEGLSFSYWNSWLKRRVMQIFIPYFVFGFLYITFRGGLSFWSGDCWDIIDGCVSLISMQGVVSMWFLPVFFFSELLFVFFVAKLSKIMQGLLVVVFVIILIFLQHNGIPDYWFSRFILKLGIALSFVVSGNFIGMFIKKRFNIVLLIIGVLICSVLALYNGFVGIGALRLGNVFLFFIVGMAMSYFIIKLFDALGRSNNSKILKLLGILGANSIVVLVTNNLLIEVFRLLEYKLLNNFFLNNGVWGGILMAIILTVPEYYLIRLSQSKLRLLFGKIEE